VLTVHLRQWFQVTQAAAAEDPYAGIALVSLVPPDPSDEQPKKSGGMKFGKQLKLEAVCKR